MRFSEYDLAQMLANNPALRISGSKPAPTEPAGPISFTVPGSPVPKPRQTQSDKWKKRPSVMKYRGWADLVRACAQEACGRFLTPNARIAMTAYIGMPRSWSGRQKERMKNQPHRVKPDADNLLKSLADSLYPDSDSMVHEMSVKKFWDDGAGARVEVTLY